MESPPPSQPPGSQKKRSTTPLCREKIPIQYESEDESGDADVEDEVESDESDVMDGSSDEDIDEEFVEIKRQSVRFLRAKLRCKKIQTTGWKKQQLIEKLEEMKQSKFTTTYLPPVPPPEGWFREELKMPDVKNSRHFGKVDLPQGTKTELDVFQLFVPDEVLETLQSTVNNSNSQEKFEKEQKQRKEDRELKKLAKKSNPDIALSFEECQKKVNKKAKKKKETKKYEVEEIIDERDSEDEDGEPIKKYLIKWKDYEETTWEPVTNAEFLTDM